MIFLPDSLIFNLWLLQCWTPSPRGFLHAQSQITKGVPLRQVSMELLHDILAADVSSDQDTWTGQQVEDSFATYLAREQQPSHYSLQWTLFLGSSTSPALPHHRLFHALPCVFCSGSTVFCATSHTI